MSKKPAKVAVELQVNGEAYEILIPPSLTLLEALRENLGLTGTKEGCGEGACGSCTVLIDGRPVRSCLTLALEAEGREITTIEGLAEKDGLDPVQESFVRHGAVQCGFCTPGMVMASKALLAENPRPSAAEVTAAISGHVCRCTGYSKIVEAVVKVNSGTEGGENG